MIQSNRDRKKATHLMNQEVASLLGVSRGPVVWIFGR
jgi:hypothetical protein